MRATQGPLSPVTVAEESAPAPRRSNLLFFGPEFVWTGPPLNFPAAGLGIGSVGTIGIGTSLFVRICWEKGRPCSLKVHAPRRAVPFFTSSTVSEFRKTSTYVSGRGLRRHRAMLRVVGRPRRYPFRWSISITSTATARPQVSRAYSKATGPQKAAGFLTSRSLVSCQTCRPNAEILSSWHVRMQHFEVE